MFLLTTVSYYHPEDVLIITIVEPEHELIQVGLKVFGRKAVIDSDP